MKYNNLFKNAVTGQLIWQCIDDFSSLGGIVYIPHKTNLEERVLPPGNFLLVVGDGFIYESMLDHNAYINELISDSLNDSSPITGDPTLDESIREEGRCFNRACLIHL